MPINASGQGNSANTPIKQEAFRYFMAVHAGIVARALKKFQSSSYYYIDTNAGTGTTDDQRDGSVLIAMDAIARNQLHMQGYAIDVRADALTSLQARLGFTPTIDLLHGDNATILRPTLLPSKKWLMGLVYCDPNGVNDLPLDALIAFFHPNVPSTQHIDVLIHFSATALKRCHGAGLEKYTLTSIMQGINKRHWYVREAFHRDQWTFLFGTNWNQWPALQLRFGEVPLQGLLSLGMFPSTSLKGQSILETLLHTNGERKKK
jgi:three-Cys-motif partner protein